MGDVADILGLAKGGSGANGGGSRPKGNAAKRPDGMSKEVFALLANGTELPPLMPSSSNAAEIYKLFAKQPAVKWTWKAFSSSARRDNLQLHHWQREAAEESDYAFARFNRRSATVSYSPEEYEALVAPTEDVSGWTREETNTLFRLCAEYDLRWHVIEDRWPLPKSRSVIEMKARYYTVAKLVVQTRRSKKASKAVAAAAAYAVAAAAAAAADSAETGKTNVERPELSAEALDAVMGRVEESTATVSAKAIAQTENALLEYTYDEAYDIKRYKQLQVLFSRTLEDEKEEISLINEVRRIDTQLRRLQKDQPRITTSSKRKNKIKGPPMLHQFPPTLVDKLLNNPAALEKETKNKKPGVYLRSEEFLTPLSSTGIGPRLQSKMDDVLNELNVPLRPVPTIAVCQAYNKIRQDILKLLALQSKLHEQNSLARKLQGLSTAPRASSSKAARNNKRKSSVTASSTASLPSPSPPASSAYPESVPPPAATTPTPSDAPARTSGRKRQPSQVVAEEMASASSVKSEPGKRKSTSGSVAGARNKKSKTS
mmetsp:Transcript_20601/g.36924  ORF Transcript_20601/g.36924 Transcript_20601/m.36924 type:complete len:543 (-) Transcript_20601:454-2082(-)|eukprot:CAMPEP_0171561240 /NCGR_PEP_ID=MMETSP0960-20121227/14195_1 /TAXON_ID=87120 /ORGANISM="Aurantiochytrium limacinum, Strain ATCCMYA-1381" /LENGTH=542 /DNA_ID=CAMNT_0012113635 /DNA_START=353 /DNA_END=1981 /DNA_ORIENTATION=-